ncbi:hypothetical protein ACN47E_005243 [Coniothyrium glycines]
MSVQDDAAQSSAAGGDNKAQAPKPAATFSSFINKNTTGKKFAPKAARRRPGAAPAALTPAPAALTPAPSALTPAPAALTPAPSAEPPPAPTEPSSLNVHTTEPSPVPQPPTPVGTQHIAIQETPAPTSQPPSISTDDVAIAHTKPSSTQIPLPTPASTSTESPVEAEAQARNVSGLANNETAATQQAEDTLDVDRARKRRRVAGPARESAGPASGDDATRIDPEAPAVQGQEGHSEVDTPAQARVDVLTPSGQHKQIQSTEHVSTDDLVPTQTHGRSQAPWVAVNHSQEHGEPAPTHAKKTPRARMRTKATADSVMEDTIITEEQEGEGADTAGTRKQRTAKARGKRKGAEPTESGTEGPPVTKPRKPRKRKEPAVATIENGEEPSTGAVPEAEGTEPTLTRHKPRAPRRKKARTTVTELEGIEGETPTVAKRKGRPPREATPSDAEDQTIDPDSTFMNSLASRNIRVGRLSTREKEMRKINWEEVKARRREEDARPIKSKEEQENADKLLAEQSAALEQPSESTVRTRLVNGVIEIIPDSGTLDREADADREIAEYEIIETQDLTTRITSRSFMKNNKRFPNDFLLPGQGKRWTIDSTDLFYQGLKSFGTDFQMISQMFPGSTRRSIKTKFTREEREHPQRVKEALHGRSEMLSNWGTFLEASQRQDDSFKDADQIRQDLAEEEASMREKIAEAKAEAAERKRQKELAGAMTDDEQGGDAANKENGKGKKKRKDKGKQVAFRDEPGVEILEENVGENSEWLQQP